MFDLSLYLTEGIFMKSTWIVCCPFSLWEVSLHVFSELFFSPLLCCAVRIFFEYGISLLCWSGQNGVSSQFCTPPPLCITVSLLSEHILYYNWFLSFIYCCGNIFLKHKRLESKMFKYWWNEYDRHFLYIWTVNHVCNIEHSYTFREKLHK